MDDIDIKIQNSYIEFVRTFLLLTKRGHISWEYADINSLSFQRDVKILRAYRGNLDKISFFLAKTSDKDPQLCIRERDKANYPYKFISQKDQREHLMIDIQDVGFSSIIQEFYETVENLIEETERNRQNEKLKEYINILKPTELLNEATNVITPEPRTQDVAGSKDEETKA